MVGFAASSHMPLLIDFKLKTLFWDCICLISYI